MLIIIFLFTLCCQVQLHNYVNTHIQLQLTIQLLLSWQENAFIVCFAQVCIYLHIRSVNITVFHCYLGQTTIVVDTG